MASDAVAWPVVKSVPRKPKIVAYVGFGGRMALADDNAARAFGKAMIRDMMLGDTPRYAGWTMDVAKGARPVCSIPFPRNESLPTDLDNVGKGT